MATDKPTPQIFALMRNGHDVIRGAQLDIQEATVDRNDLEGANKRWVEFFRWNSLHLFMEEGNGSKDVAGFFKLFDKHCEQVTTTEGLFDAHVDLHEKEEAVEQAFKLGEMPALQTAFAEFESVNLAHLKKEEDIMMPMVMKLMKSGHPMKKYMKEDILAVVPAQDMEFFVKFANQMLKKQHGGMPRVRVFQRTCCSGRKRSVGPVDQGHGHGKDIQRVAYCH